MAVPRAPAASTPPAAPVPIPEGHRDRGTEGRGDRRPWGTPLAGAEGSAGGCRQEGGCCAGPVAWPCCWPPPPPTSGCSAGRPVAPPASGCGTPASGDTAAPSPAPRPYGRPRGC